mmetsp:Transcript_15985/g.29067  ORF Transcript_15985/g.29067 Transcript_15985/m.29067 type:complete len:84 (+) Transcript_15985:205-456(+)
MRERQQRSTPGALLLRTQMKPFTQEFGVFEIEPCPGRLVLFPGYVPHAVLPRCIGPASAVAKSEKETLDAPSLRISVACNCVI